MIYTTCSRRYLSFSGLVQFASAKQPQAADGREGRVPTGDVRNKWYFVMTSYDFPRGQPGQSQRFDPSRGPQRAACFLLAQRAKREESDALGSLRFLDGKPGSPLRAQASIQRQKTNRNHEGNMKKTEPKTSRHHGSSKRPNRFEVILTDEENSRLEELSTAAGVMKPTQLVRKLIMGGGTVNAALTVEERKLITDLGKMGTNIWQIRKDLMKHGTDSQLLKDLETMYEDFSEIKEYFKEMIKK